MLVAMMSELGRGLGERLPEEGLAWAARRAVCMADAEPEGGGGSEGLSPGGAVPPPEMEGAGAEVHSCPSRRWRTKGLLAWRQPATHWDTRMMMSAAVTHGHAGQSAAGIRTHTT